MRKSLALIALAAMIMLMAGPDRAAADDGDNPAIANSLATLLRSARSVISGHQSLINNADIGDKGLSGGRILKEALERYRKSTGTDPLTLDADGRHGRLIRAQMKAVSSVVDAYQSTINEKGIGLKGFTPAVFARLVNERFGLLVGDEARIKVTAPPMLVRNRKARPDAWEAEIIKTKFSDPGWRKGRAFSARMQAGGRPAFRMLLPEYYGKSCLSCHGLPKGEIDVTGYPKEGASEGQLGGVISIVLYH